jgi:hypothetical protein
MRAGQKMPPLKSWMYPQVVFEMVPALEHSFLAAHKVLGKLLGEKSEEPRCRKAALQISAFHPRRPSMSSATVWWMKNNTSAPRLCMSKIAHIGI